MGDETEYQCWKMSTLRNWRVASLRLYSSQPPTAFDEKLKTEFVARAARAKPLRPLPKVDNLSSTAAVLVPLVSVNGQPSLLFTARSWSLNTHRGEGTDMNELEWPR